MSQPGQHSFTKYKSTKRQLKCTIYITIPTIIALITCIVLYIVKHKSQNKFKHPTTIETSNKQQQPTFQLKEDQPQPTQQFTIQINEAIHNYSLSIHDITNLIDSLSQKTTNLEKYIEDKDIISILKTKQVKIQNILVGYFDLRDLLFGYLYLSEKDLDETYFIPEFTTYLKLFSYVHKNVLLVEFNEGPDEKLFEKIILGDEFLWEILFLFKTHLIDNNEEINDFENLINKNTNIQLFTKKWCWELKKISETLFENEITTVPICTKKIDAYRTRLIKNTKVYKQFILHFSFIYYLLCFEFSKDLLVDRLRPEIRSLVEKLLPMQFKKKNNIEQEIEKTLKKYDELEKDIVQRCKGIIQNINSHIDKNIDFETLKNENDKCFEGLNKLNWYFVFGDE